MTEQQAIKIIKEEKSWESDDRKIDAFIMAIDSLKKQTPKRPKIRKEFYGYDYFCPVCEKSVNYVGFKYCSECGQKIEWNDEV